MAKKVKVKEIEPKMKVIRELGKEEIADITKGEPRMHDTSGVEGGEMMGFGTGVVRVSPVLRNEQAGNDVRADAVRAAQQGTGARATVREQSGAQLYAVGRGMGSETAGQRANYRQAQQTSAATRVINTNTTSQPLQSRGMAGGAAWQQGIGARNVMDQQEGAVPERPYSEGGEKKRERRVGPWE